MTTSRLSRISASTFARGGFRLLTKPVQVTHGGQLLGLYVPVGVAPLLEADVQRLRIRPRRHPDDALLTALQAAMDAQGAVVAVEELAAELRGVAPGIAALAEYQRRRAAYLVAFKGPMPTTEPSQQQMGDTE